MKAMVRGCIQSLGGYCLNTNPAIRSEVPWLLAHPKCLYQYLITAFRQVDLTMGERIIMNN